MINPDLDVECSMLINISFMFGTMRRKWTRGKIFTRDIVEQTTKPWPSLKVASRRYSGEKTSIWNVSIIFTNNYSWVVQAENAFQTLLPSVTVDVTWCVLPFSPFFSRLLRLRCFRASASWEAWRALPIITDRGVRSEPGEVAGHALCFQYCTVDKKGLGEKAANVTRFGQKISSEKQNGPE